MRFTYQNGAQPLAGYTIQRGIHRGGFGEVYFARSDGGKDVALKLLHEQDQDIEIRGVTQCLNLKHPNLVNIFDIKTDSHGDHWVIMEYVNGSSLEDILGSFPDGLPLEEVQAWICGLVAGVAYLHDRGIVHRDLKPANVYRENGVVKVGDVGLSKRFDSDRRRAHTQSVGTVYYMAPEVARGQYGPEVDVYSLGVILYELITGKLPFTGETTAEILMKHLTAQPDLTPIPKLLRPAIAHALEKDPQKRTPSVRQLESEFLRTNGNASDPELIPESAFLPPPIPPRSSRGGKQGADPWISIRVNRPYPTRKVDKQPPPTSAGHRSSWNWTKCFQFAGIAAAFIFMNLLFSHQSIVQTTGFHGPWGPHIVWSHHSSSPFTRAPWMWIGLAAVIGLLWRSRHSSSQQASNVPPRPPVDTPARETAAKVNQKTESRRRSKRQTDYFTDVPWQQRLPLLFQSLASAGFFASCLSVGVYLLLAAVDRAKVMPSIEHAFFFTATSIIGTWLVLIGHFILTGTRWSRGRRWLFCVAVGSLIGSAAYGLDQFLLIETPHAAFTADSGVGYINSRPLLNEAYNPTWLGYSWFFAGWVGFRRWLRDLNPLRTSRYSIGLVIASVAVAFGMSMAFKFPQWNAMLWAGTIGTTAQLASHWSPVPKLVERT